MFILLILMEQPNYPIDKIRDECIVIDKSLYIKTDLLSIPIEYKKYLSSVAISYGFICDRIEELARRILTENNNKDITFVVCMKSALMYSNYLMKFMTNLKKDINFTGSIYFEYISSTSYKGMKSTGELVIQSSDEVFKSLEGKDIIILEDMYDSGSSLNQLIEYMKRFKIKSIKISSLFLKANVKHLKYDLKLDYIGFCVPEDAFVVGFGMDYNELFRDLNHSCLVSEEGLKLLKEKFASG